MKKLISIISATLLILSCCVCSSFTAAAEETQSSSNISLSAEFVNLMLKKCPYCQKDISDAADDFEADNTEAQSSVFICPECNKEIDVKKIASDDYTAIVKSLKPNYTDKQVKRVVDCMTGICPDCGEKTLSKEHSTTENGATIKSSYKYCPKCSFNEETELELSETIETVGWKLASLMLLDNRIIGSSTSSTINYEKAEFKIISKDEAETILQNNTYTIHTKVTSSAITASSGKNYISLGFHADSISDLASDGISVNDNAFQYNFEVDETSYNNFRNFDVDINHVKMAIIVPGDNLTTVYIYSDVNETEIGSNADTTNENQESTNITSSNNEEPESSPSTGDSAVSSVIATAVVCISGIAAFALLKKKKEIE